MELEPGTGEEIVDKLRWQLKGELQPITTTEDSVVERLEELQLKGEQQQEPTIHMVDNYKEAEPGTGGISGKQAGTELCQAQLS